MVEPRFQGSEMKNVFESINFIPNN